MLKHQICLVTGASRGIGHAIAVALGRQGATIIGTSTSQKGANYIGESLNNNDINGFGVVMDVTEKQSIDTTVHDVIATHGTPSVLVNNAGITRDGLLMRMKDTDWDVVIDTNLKSVYRLCKALLRPMMKARFGRIINISSVVGAIGNAGQSNYCASKSGLLGFTMSLAREVAARNITVNAVAPGFIDTDMTRNLEQTQKQQLLSQIPLGRLGTADDVAQAVVFLASPMANYVTGSTLHVNGGMLMA
ncbi:MAG TPA: 3-oxoacyl-ACP reductase FabG [Gammaproteobacteria bacterium]|nr:3-oxoacyl-ACP reductase FabG [Gammaproteobacteria bacterium]